MTPPHTPVAAVAVSAERRMAARWRVSNTGLRSERAVREMNTENEATLLGRANEVDNASGPTQLSDTTPTRLIQSRGNLYWSSNPYVIEIRDAPNLQVNAPTFFRASKSSQPGQEVALYAEQGTGGEFGALTLAKVDGEFYGYFVANYAAMSQIKRIPLGAVTTSGNAHVLPTVPAELPPRSVPVT